MSKRSQRQKEREEQGLFDNLQDTPSLEDSSDAIFGINPFPSLPQVRVKLVDIHSIFPDPSQPRRAIPSELRERWNIHEHTIEDLIALWFSYMEDFDLEAYLFDGMTNRAQRDDKGDPIIPNFEPTDPVQVSFIRLLELTSSILRDGLTNPITISRVGRDYMVETGERRWLAYHFLNAYFEDNGDQDWSKIPARIMPERNVWRQATENNARQNLNAVARARQLAILLMDIHGWDNFRQLSDFENEQDFYAQVQDGTQWRIPADKTEQLLKAMGLNNQTQLRQYRAILRLDSITWRVADDNDWTESAIRLHQQRQKNVTSVTEKGKPIMRFVKDMDKQIATIEKAALQSKFEERLEWMEYAKQLSYRWKQLAEKLDTSG